MRAVKMAILAGAFGTLSSVSTFAVPLDITITGGAVSHDWNGGPAFYGDDFRFEDNVGVASYNNGQFNLAGVNSINVTWQAPAGYMYVVNPPPASIGPLQLAFEAAYGNGVQDQTLAASLGSVTSSSLSVQTIYGNSPLGGGAVLSKPGANPFGQALDFTASGSIGSGTMPFAFSSITISADFSGTGTDGTMTVNPADGVSGLFGTLFGIFRLDGVNGPSDPGQLLTLEPLPSGSVPDVSSTLSLAGLGFAGLFFAGRKQKRLAVNC